jgi:hypothetical protein
LKVTQVFNGKVENVWNVETLYQNLNRPNESGSEGLTREISRLKEEASVRAQSSDQEAGVGEISRAAEAARAGNAAKAIQILRSAGGWVLALAKEVGSSVIAKLIEGHIALG